MWRWSRIVAGLVVLAAAYWVWPLVGAGQLASAAQSGDTAGVFDRVDLPALRRSLARQIARAYLQASGKAQKLGILGREAAGAAVTTIADPYVAELLTPENLTALIGQGRINQVRIGDRDVAVDRTLPNFPNIFRSDILSAVTGSYFDGLADFVIPIRAKAAQSGVEDDYNLHMRLGGLSWRLSGIDLPPAMVEDMARKIMAGDKQPAP